jgi:hypothetical protein
LEVNKNFKRHLFGGLMLKKTETLMIQFPLITHGRLDKDNPCFSFFLLSEAAGKADVL